MSPASATPKRRRAFGAVGTGLMVGHAVVAVATIAFSVLAIVQFSAARVDLGHWRLGLMVVVLAIPATHLVLMTLVMPVWSGLAARTQTGVSRLWAWLGYFIPVAGYWLPGQTLRALAAGADPEAPRRRALILAWTVARGVAAPSATIGVALAISRTTLPSHEQGMVMVTYWIIAYFAANLLSLLMIAQMRQHFATGAVEASHAEVFT